MIYLIIKKTVFILKTININIIEMCCEYFYNKLFDKYGNIIHIILFKEIQIVL